MRIYKENTSDRGCIKTCTASDNFAEYQLTSAYAHDLYTDFVERYNRVPSSNWYNKHFSFTRIK